MWWNGHARSYMCHVPGPLSGGMDMPVLTPRQHQSLNLRDPIVPALPELEFIRVTYRLWS